MTTIIRIENMYHTSKVSQLISSSSSSPTQSLICFTFLYVSFCCSAIPCKWNHTFHSPLCLASLTRCNFFSLRCIPVLAFFVAESHPCVLTCTLLKVVLMTFWEEVKVDPCVQSAVFLISLMSFFVFCFVYKTL